MNPIEDSKQYEEQIKILINKMQNHICRKDYCLLKNKDKYRFNFALETKDFTGIYK